jgi:hypothetical protein
VTINNSAIYNNNLDGILVNYYSKNIKLNNTIVFNNGNGAAYNIGSIRGIENKADANEVKYYGYLRAFNNNKADGTNYLANNYYNISK